MLYISSCLLRSHIDLNLSFLKQPLVVDAVVKLAYSNMKRVFKLCSVILLSIHWGYLCVTSHPLLEKVEAWLNRVKVWQVRGEVEKDNMVLYTKLLYSLYTRQLAYYQQIRTWLLVLTATLWI